MDFKAPKKTWFQARDAKALAGTRSNQQCGTTKNQLETSDRTKQLLRSVYPINQSGSKQIVIGADPDADFKPVISIRKPGYKGVILSPGATSKFITGLEEFLHYCVAEDSGVKSVQLSEKEMLEFDIFQNKKALYIRKDLGDGKVATIILTGATLFFLGEIYELLKHAFDSLDCNVGEIKGMFDAMKAKVMEGSDRRQEKIKVMKPVDIVFAPAADTNLDYFRLFLELKKFCELELTA